MTLYRVTVDDAVLLLTDKRDAIGPHLVARGIDAVETDDVWTSAGHAIVVEVLELDAGQAAAFALDGVLP